jgi:SPP1 gp7 family putative phage head morphogenesis protein
VPVHKVKGAGERLARRAKAVAMIRATVAARKQYVTDLRNILGGLHRVFMKSLGLRQDAKHPALDFHTHMAALDEAIGQVRQHAGKAFDLMASRLNKANHKQATALLGITPSEQGVQHKIGEFREANVALVEKAGRTYAASVRDIFTDPDNFGKRWEELKDDLEERGEVAGSHAELIARDQTLKLNGALNELRQTNAGVSQYVWSTSKDERVRPEHAELEGTTQSWDDPPLINGEALNPGEDFQCRCVAIPVIDLGEEAEAS